MNNDITALQVLFTETYYWITIVIMFLIHVGFCTYEVGVSRRKNHLTTLLKNTMVIPVVGVSFYLFGWWLYSVDGERPGHHRRSGRRALRRAVERADGGPYGRQAARHQHHRRPIPRSGRGSTACSGRAFLLFSWTTASIVSGSIIERVKSGAFWIIAVLLGSVTWIIDAAWGWHPAGWMVQLLGYHDAYASGVVHAIAGGTALAVLINLGPRIGKFRPDGTPRNIPPQNPWLVCIGLFLIYTGFWGFYAACNIPIYRRAGRRRACSGRRPTSICSRPRCRPSPSTSSCRCAGGLMAGYFISKADAYWTFSGGLAGVIACSAGNDLYHPIQAMFIAAVIVVIIYKMHYWVERRFKIDDAVGAVAVHGYAGFLGVVAAGFVLWGYPSSPDACSAMPPGHDHALGSVHRRDHHVLGARLHSRATSLSWILKQFGLLRIPREVELAGLDYAMELATQRDDDEIRDVLAQEAAVFTAGTGRANRSRPNRTNGDHHDNRELHRLGTAT